MYPPTQEDTRFSTLCTAANGTQDVDNLSLTTVIHPMLRKGENEKRVQVQIIHDFPSDTVMIITTQFGESIEGDTLVTAAALVVVVPKSF
jgi:hypothetical protein